MHLLLFFSFLLLSGRSEAFVARSRVAVVLRQLQVHCQVQALPASVTEIGMMNAFIDVSSTTTLVAHGAEEAPAAAVPFLFPILGSSAIMFTIVALLYLWEESVEWIRDTLPPALLPVIEAILAEIGGLGFIGLLLQTTLNNANREALEELSVKLFGEGEILIETFEYLHTAFFQVGVGFFVAAGAMVAVGLQKLAEIETVEELQVDTSTGACTVTADKLSSYLPIITDAEDLNEPPIQSLWDEIPMGTEERAGKVLLMRSRLVDLYDLPQTFRIEKYLQGAFAESLLELVELSPLTWIYLIPALSLANSIDLSHEVVNAASPNAADSAGFFFSTPWAFWPAGISVIVSFVWGIWNCWKLTQIKYMLLPRLGKDPETGAISILAPPIDSEQARNSFDSSPAWVQPIEALWAKPARTNYEHLFGTVGAGGLELYRNSIKFQSWLCITHIIFFGFEIVPRDIDALLTGAQVGDPSHLIAEFVAYSSFVLLSLIQLIFVTPRAFWNYCLVACAEDRVSEELLKESLVLSGD